MFCSAFLVNLVLLVLVGFGVVGTVLRVAWVDRVVFGVASVDPPGHSGSDCLDFVSEFGE